MHMMDQIDEVLKKHLGLTYNQEDNRLSGKLFLSDGDSYEVLIKLEKFPKFFPEVFETDGRIPVKMDCHMYPNNGSCCFATRAKSQVLLKTKVHTLLIFVDEILVKYLENNSFYELNNHYYGEEYAHGTLGVIQGYIDILEVDSIELVVKAIYKASISNTVKIHQDCYCGSNRRLRKCNHRKHLKNLRLLYLVDKSILKSDLQSIIEVMSK